MCRCPACPSLPASARCLRCDWECHRDCSTAISPQTCIRHACTGLTLPTTSFFQPFGTSKEYLHPIGWLGGLFHVTLDPQSDAILSSLTWLPLVHCHHSHRSWWVAQPCRKACETLYAAELKTCAIIAKACRSRWQLGACAPSGDAAGCSDLALLFSGFSSWPALTLSSSAAKAGHELRATTADPSRLKSSRRPDGLRILSGCATDRRVASVAGQC